MPPRTLGTKANALPIVGRVSALAFGLFLDWWLFFSALSVDERQEIFRVKRVQASGLLSGGTQGDIYAPVVGQDHHLQITHHLLPVFRTQVGILRHQFLYLFRTQIVILAKRPRLDGGCEHAMFNQETLGAFYATLR
jgi:hypothetical protein